MMLLRVFYGICGIAISLTFLAWIIEDISLVEFILSSAMIIGMMLYSTFQMIKIRE